MFWRKKDRYAELLNDEGKTLAEQLYWLKRQVKALEEEVRTLANERHERQAEQRAWLKKKGWIQYEGRIPSPMWWFTHPDHGDHAFKLDEAMKVQKSLRKAKP